MLKSTLELIQCPRCQKPLRFLNENQKGVEVRSGWLVCTKCKGGKYPIIEGVAILVPEPKQYILEHVKGFAAQVSDDQIPKEYLKDYREAKAEIQTEHIEEDLEAERVVALYLMNHYLRVSDSKASNQIWWRGVTTSELHEKLIEQYWDKGPFFQIETWIKKMTGGKSVTGKLQLVELGCGVGGLFRQLSPTLEKYLGVDSSFASILLARHLNLGTQYKTNHKIPADLLQGATSRAVLINKTNNQTGQVDYVVGDLNALPVRRKIWNVTAALNAMDMLEEPWNLPVLQSELLEVGGWAIQSCPYIWHEMIAKQVRARVPKSVQTSSSAVCEFYKKSGFEITESIEHHPWLFFKNLRQLELYSVHMLLARNE